MRASILKTKIITKYILTFILSLYISVALALAEGVCGEDTFKAINTYLNSIRTMVASFDQVNREGELQKGIFYLSKPGHLKWEYPQLHNSMLLVDGKTIIYYDGELEEVTNVPAHGIMASLLGESAIDVRKRVGPRNCIKSNGEVRLLFSDIGSDPSRENAIQSMTIVFKTSPLLIDRLLILEEEQIKTEIRFRDIKYNVILPERVFIFKDPRFFNNELD